MIEQFLSIPIISKC